MHTMATTLEDLVSFITDTLLSRAHTRRLTHERIQEIATIITELVAVKASFILKADGGAVANSYQYAPMTDKVEVSYLGATEDRLLNIEAGRGYGRKVAHGDTGRIYVVSDKLPETLTPVKRRGSEYWF